MSIDIANQNDVNAPGWGRWPRGREVSIDGGQLSCKLREDTYSLEESYKYSPHLQFMNLDSEEQLRHFVRAWGPLWMSVSERNSGVAKMPLERYWSCRRWLRSFADLLRAFHERKMERDYLRAFLFAAIERSRVIFPDRPLLEVNEIVLLRAFLTSDPLALRLSGTWEPFYWEDWLDRVDLRAVREATAYLVEQAVPVTATIEAVWKTRPPRLRARWCSHYLEDALEWMVLQDALDDKLPRFCSECGKAFRPVSGHQTKYCRYECGHKVAARQWARRARTTRLRHHKRTGRRNQ